MSSSCENNVTPSIVNDTVSYVLNDVMKNKTGDGTTSSRSEPSPCSDLSTNKSLSLTFGYIGEVC